jgi:hypothetical protein
MRRSTASGLIDFAAPCSRQLGGHVSDGYLRMSSEVAQARFGVGSRRSVRVQDERLLGGDLRMAVLHRDAPLSSGIAMRASTSKRRSSRERPLRGAATLGTAIRISISLLLWWWPGAPREARCDRRRFCRYGRNSPWVDGDHAARAAREGSSVAADLACGDATRSKGRNSMKSRSTSRCSPIVDHTVAEAYPEPPVRGLGRPTAAAPVPKRRGMTHVPRPSEVVRRIGWVT